MTTLFNYFKKNKDKLPVSYGFFKKKFLTKEVIKDLADKRIILALGSDKRRIIKILDEDAFYDYFFRSRK